jgi:hypothetical protein
MLPASGYLRLAFLWAMIPLTVFAGRPCTGCTCASGEYKPVCAAHVDHHFAGHVSSPHAGKCEKLCCRRETRADHHVDDYCQSGLGSPSTGAGNCGSKNCCNPDMVTAVIVASGTTSSVGNEHRMQLGMPIVSFAETVGDWQAIQICVHETGPPVGDLVISLRRLLV